jgi:hypothetical protein
MAEKSSDKVTITFAPESTALARETQAKLSLPTEVDVFRLGLVVLGALATARELGCSVVMHGKDGKMFSYSLDNPTEMVPVTGPFEAICTDAIARKLAE